MLRLAVISLMLLGCCFALAQTSSVDVVREIRLQGNLSNALSRATSQLSSADAQTAFELHLELARIHDRIGLHNNTRPVAAALRHVQSAAVIAESLDTNADARVQLALAEYYYRAEMSDRVFEKATSFAEAALEQFDELGERHGQADAVHRLGLIALQRGHLHAAHEYFDLSLQLDLAGGERAVFRGDYERHVGFVFAFQDDVSAALPYYERSLTYRIKGGAIDASMFAAISVAAALVELDRTDEALPHLEYALRIAADIGSDIGRDRAQRITEKIRASETAR
jgi:tetratricopeptide (TPR) repeat protein